MAPSPAFSRRCRDMWALTDPSAVSLWQLGVAWSSLAAVVDAWTGRRLVLSDLVLVGPYCVLFTGRWLRTAVAGAWAICLVVVLGVPDGIWGSHLETFLIGLAVFVAVSSTLALVITLRTGLSLALTAFLATACGSHAASSGRRPTVSAARPVSCGQQYEAWKHGPASAQDSRLRAVLNAVQAAERSRNAAAMRSAMKELMPAAVATAAAGGIPHCTDPVGLYDKYISTIYAAGYNARSAEGLGDLLKAAAVLKELKNIELQLTAEVNGALAKN